MWFKRMTANGTGALWGRLVGSPCGVSCKLIHRGVLVMAVSFLCAAAGPSHSLRLRLLLHLPPLLRLAFPLPSLRKVSPALALPVIMVQRSANRVPPGPS